MQGQLTKYSFDGGNNGAEHIDAHTYNANGDIAKQEIYNWRSVGSYTSVRSYSYDSQKRLLEITYDGNGDGKIDEQTNVTYPDAKTKHKG